MKKCKTCGRELELEMFYANKAHKDGHDIYCKDCRKAMNSARQKAKREKSNEVVCSDSHNLIKVYSSPELAKFTPRQLMQELKARGYKWEYMLEPQRKVMYDKI